MRTDVVGRAHRVTRTLLTLLLAVVPAAATHAEPIKVRLGYQSLWAAGGEVTEVLRHTNIFALNGIEAEFKTFTFGGPLGEAAVAGDIDNVFAADAPVLRAMARMPGSKVFLFTHDARFGVLVRPDYEGGLAQLKGEKMSAPFATTVFPRTVRAIEAAGVAQPLRNIMIVNQDIAEQTSAMQGKLVDAVATWDPTMERLIQQKIAKPIWFAPRGENMGMQGFSGKWLAKYGEDGVVRFVKAWVMATWWASNHMEQAHDWFGKTSRLPPDILKVATDFDRHLASPVGDIKTINLVIADKDIASTQGVMDFLFDNKLLNARIDAKSYFDMGPATKAQAEIAAGNLPDLASIKVVTP